MTEPPWCADAGRPIPSPRTLAPPPPAPFPLSAPEPPPAIIRYSIAPGPASVTLNGLLPDVVHDIDIHHQVLFQHLAPPVADPPVAVIDGDTMEYIYQQQHQFHLA